MENVNLLLEEYKENLFKGDKDLKNKLNVTPCYSTASGPAKSEVEDIVKKSADDTTLNENHILKVQDLTRDVKSSVSPDKTSEFSGDGVPVGCSDLSRDVKSSVSPDKTSEFSGDGVPVGCSDLSRDVKSSVLHDKTSEFSADGVLDDCRDLPGDAKSSVSPDKTSEFSADGVLDDCRDLPGDARPPVLCYKTSADGALDDCGDAPVLSLGRDGLCSTDVSANNSVITYQVSPEISREGHRTEGGHFVNCKSLDVDHVLTNSCHVEVPVENSDENHPRSPPINVTMINSGEYDEQTTCTTSQTDCSSHQLSHIHNSQVKLKGDCSSVCNGRENASSESCNQSEMYEACSNLGQNLISLYLEEWGSDQDIMVSGRTFKTHKCILAARSPYFSAMFGGSWRESDNDCIKLEGISPTVFEQALLYLYGGVIDINKACSLLELLLVADMYGIEGLKDVVGFHLRKEYCHFFHKPCSVCTTTLADALMLSVSFGLDDVKHRCLKSVWKFFTKFWSTKAFAGLSEDVLELTCDYIASQLTEKTVIETILECHKLSDSLPRVKWAEPVLHWTTKLLELSIEYTSEHFVDVVSSEQFLSWGKKAAWSRSFLDEIFRTVIDSLPTEKACGSYRALLRLHEFNTSLESDIYGEDVTCLLQSLISHCETYIKVYIHQVTQTAEWPLLPEEVKTKILQNSSFVCIDPCEKGRGTMPVGQKSKVSAAVIQALREDHSFRQKRTVFDKTRKASEKTSNKRVPNVDRKPAASSPRQKLSHQTSDSFAESKLSEKKIKKNGISAQSQNISSSCDNNKLVNGCSKTQTQGRHLRLASPRIDEKTLNPESQTEESLDQSQGAVGSAGSKTSRSSLRHPNPESQTEESLDQSLGAVGSAGSKSSRSGLRHAQSTGSLHLRPLSVVVPGNRSLSTENIDVDAWGFTRKPVSCHTLETLVPLFETMFCKPCDLGEF
ncbi:uncharacterized protein LOC121384618 [Gigantopelta aegis]|uniref:uncharacterized protein LOC121384618 n=1 Tax=Gigantopelta aegis TaxID=1735272 RepID=UPI001B88A612|nr:uncharacterized protein LOC121384618 [Gigantopelta aegis]